MTLEEFFALEAAKPFVRALNDCTMMCDRWVQLKRGVSPVAAGPICYSDDESALAIMPMMPLLMNRAMRSAGIKKTKSPLLGDVGLIVYRGGMGPAIHAGSQWITRCKSGLIAAPLGNAIKVWAVCERDT